MEQPFHFDLYSILYKDSSDVILELLQSQIIGKAGNLDFSALNHSFAKQHCHKAFDKNLLKGLLAEINFFPFLFELLHLHSFLYPYLEGIVFQFVQCFLLKMCANLLSLLPSQHQLLIVALAYAYRLVYAIFENKVLLVTHYSGLFS
jgi:hypothetical protein